MNRCLTAIICNTLLLNILLMLRFMKKDTIVLILENVLTLNRDPQRSRSQVKLILDCNCPGKFKLTTLELNIIFKDIYDLERMISDIHQLINKLQSVQRFLRVIQITILFFNKISNSYKLLTLFFSNMPSILFMTQINFYKRIQNKTKSYDNCDTQIKV